MSKTPSSSPEGRFFYDLTIDSEDEENKHGKKATSGEKMTYHISRNTGANESI